jgi:hypothetical protein
MIFVREFSCADVAYAAPRQVLQPTPPDWASRSSDG